MFLIILAGQMIQEIKCFHLEITHANNSDYK